MHLHFEKTVNAKSDCSILSLTWMGKVPDEIPEDEGWKLNRTNYYQEGWLATGNVRGIVGVTFTTSHCKKNVEFPPRTNYNLRGHRSEVILVKWNEPYQKLASCDSSGIIFVWIKYEGRWSIELINDRNTPVTNFSWSHDGRMALICYQDGFVLVGSVAGQRYWSSMLNLEATISCGIWTPDDQQVYFGTTSGQIIVMDVHGAMVSQVQLSHDSIGITNMAWSCEKFKMEESDENDAVERKFILAVCLQNGAIYLLKNFDDVSPLQIQTGLQGPLCMEWSNSREILAIAGVESTSKSAMNQSIEYTNILKFYNERGVLLYRTRIPGNGQSMVSSLTWGHNDKRLFLATGTQIHIAWISRRIATLQLLCRLKIHEILPDETRVQLLPLPARIRNVLVNLFAQTIRCCVPEPSNLRRFVSKPPSNAVRLHCTMIRHDDNDSNLSSGTCYTLYLEYLGGLVPLLKGKRTSKIRPEFVIFDPQNIDKNNSPAVSSSSSNGRNFVLSDSSDSEREEGGCTSSPRLQRKRKKKRNKATANMQNFNSSETDNEELTYLDTLPEHVPLVEVTSNIWGTKFKIHGLEAASTPANLGQVTYKTSLLHLQPRQMTLIVTELRDDFPVLPDPNFNPNLFSEDEDFENSTRNQRSNNPNTRFLPPPIAPILPSLNNPHGASSRMTKSHQFTSSFLAPENNSNNGSSSTSQNDNNHLAKAESYEDPDQEHSFCDKMIRPQTPSCTNVNNKSVYLNLRPHTSSSQAPTLSHQFGSSNVAAISPLHYESSVPTLQSPKNAVAPSDIIFERPPAQTLISYSNVQQLILKHAKKDEEPLPGPSERLEMVRSCSVGYLDLVADGGNTNNNGMVLLKDTTPRRLILVNKKPRAKQQKNRNLSKINNNIETRENSAKSLRNCGKSRSLDSSDFHEKNNKKLEAIVSEKEKPMIEIKSPNSTSSSNTSSSSSSSGSSNNVENNNNNNNISNKKKMSKLSHFVSKSPLMRRRKNSNSNSNSSMNNEQKDKSSQPLHTQALTNLEKLLTRLREDGKCSAPSSPRLPRSSPASPAPSKKGKRPQSASPVRRNLLSSPLLGRKNRKNKLQQESSDDETAASGDEKLTGGNYRDLETFQKAQLRQKLKRGKIEPNGSSVPFIIPQRREFVMHNKAPMWNENSQVYQLDFGGRVTQESAKNFQIEFRGKQVMQFGRIDGNAYTLDFQYPFSALQAFSVALANVTQRLK